NWIQRSNNLVTDIIPGASIRLKDTGTVNFTITNNEDDMADKVQSFIDEYNALLDYIDEITKVVLDSEGKADIGQAGILTGNYAVNMLRSSLRGFVGTRAVGFSGDNDVYSLLTQVGMSSSDGGRIDFDRDQFKRALNENPDDLIRLFSAEKVGSLDNNNFIYIAGTNQTEAGIYDFTVSYDLEGKIDFVSYKDKTTGKTYTSDDPEEIRISENGKQFTVFGGSARGAALQTVGVTGSQDTFTLTVKDGKAKSFSEELDRLFDDKTGLTKVLEKNYENIIRNIDVRIDREMMRVDQIKKRLERRFATLEVNMQNWNGQMERLQQQIAQLPSQ
ncbi:MAG: flagellar filament capping protein FliD, partial [Candidatus Cloacimonetes bacterium]|nr:flagellar filament capping protein FliD [Candidatus Cloacimonadota bacterium]